MFSSRNNIPVQCQICGFPFAVLVVKGVRPAWCPSCGSEFTCSSVEVDSDTNSLNPDPAIIVNQNEFYYNSDQFDTVDRNIVTENIDTQNNYADNNNIDIDKNIQTANKIDNSCNNNSTSDSNVRYSVFRRCGILLTTVSIQIIALIMLPVLIFSTAANVDLGVNGDGIIDNEISVTKITNPDLSKDVTQSELDVLCAASAQIEPVTSKCNTVVANDAVTEKNLDSTESMTHNPNTKTTTKINDTGDYDSCEFINYSVKESLPQPTILTSNRSKQPHNAKHDDLRERVGVERAVHVESADCDEPDLSKTISDDLSKSCDDSDLLSSKNENIKTENETENKYEIEYDKANVGAKAVGNVDGETDNFEEMESLSYEMRLERARELLQEGGKLAAVSPERGLQLVIQAIKCYKELGQTIPPEAKWFLSKAYVMQRWGEALVENIPSLESMSISSDGQWLWCRCEDNTVWIWDILRSKKTLSGFKLESGDLKIAKLVFTPDFRFAFGVGVDGLVRVWNMELSEPVRSVVLLGGRVSNPVDAKISPDGRWLVVSGIIGEVGQGSDAGEGISSEFNGNGSGTAWLWDLNPIKNWDSFYSGEELKPVILRGHNKPIRVVQISDDSSWLATGSEDATARVYNLRSTYPGSEQTVLKGHQAGIISVIFSSKGGWIATGSQDNTVRVWQLSSSKNPPDSVELRGHIGWVSSLAADDSGNRLVSGSFDKTIRIWKIPAKNIEQSAIQEPVIIQTDQGSVKQLLLTRDGKILVSLGGDFSLRLWGVGNGGDFDLKNTFLVRNRLLPITNAAITPDDRYLIFNYINQKDSVNSGIRLLHLRLEELLKSAEGL
ncbi:MAG: WD40 repeat domain-containing protein [Planctomycetaceae bacterium]|jgi:WD40 repeat protein|nr:WD40 repeat domain-containing protein [Planctomycetaceae bacterium]